MGKEGRVLSFEPSRREFRDLLRNLEINGVDNVLPFFCGLSDAGGTGLLQVAPDVHSGKSHYVDGAGQLSLQLDLREWDSHIQSLIGGRETWIKIDVEGYEVRVIRSLEKSIAPRHPWCDCGDRGAAAFRAGIPCRRHLSGDGTDGLHALFRHGEICLQ